MHGPIDYLVIEFPGNKFKGEILKELNRSIENQTISLLDLSLITKDADGNVASVEVADPQLFGEMLAPERPATSIINADDVEEIGELLQNNTSAGLLVIEHTWARDLKRAIMNANGNLVAEGRIHPDAYEELTTEEEV